MTRRTIQTAAVLAVLFLFSVGCVHAQMTTQNTGAAANPLDNALFDQATAAMDNSKYAEARTLLQEFLDSQPDSNLVPRAKLLIGDACYAEGTFQQAEAEYQDFVTFFPNRPETVEAQKKIDSIRQKTGM